MSYRPPARSRTQSSLSRRRAARRQEQARLVAFGLLGLVALGLILLLVLGLKSCFAPKGPALSSSKVSRKAVGTEKTPPKAAQARDKPAAGTDAKAAAKLKLASRKRFKPAPFGMVHDSSFLYAAQEQSHFSLFGQAKRVHPDLYRLDSLTCYKLDGGKRSWEAALDASFSDIGLTASSVVLFNPYEAYDLGSAEQKAPAAEAAQSAEASAPENQGLMVTAFNSSDGGVAWSQSVRGALDASIAMDSRTVAVTYRDPVSTTPTATLDAAAASGADGAASTARASSVSAMYASQLRLVLFNAATGQKAYTPQLNLKDLQYDQLDQRGEIPALSLHCWEGLLGWSCFNVMELLGTGDGKQRYHYTAPGTIYNMVYDPAVHMCYVLSGSTRPGAYELTAINLAPKIKDRRRSLLNFDAGSEQILLLAERGYAALALQTGVPAGQKERAEESRSAPQLTTRLVCFQAGKDKPVLDHNFASGQAVDLAAVPGSSGNFLLALADSTDRRGLPRGHGKLYRARSGDASVQEVADTRQPILWLTPFRNECLVLFRGGQIRRYLPAGDKLIDLGRGASDVLEPVPGSAKDCVVVSSYPPAWIDGKAGQPLQTLAWQ